MKCPKCGCEMTCKTIDASRQWYEYRCPKCGYGEGYATIQETPATYPTGNPYCPMVSATELEVEQKWNALRNQAAIACLAQIVGNIPSDIQGDYTKAYVEEAINYADELVKQLKEK